MRKKINRPAGFWIRLSSRLVDFLIFTSLSLVVAYFNLSTKGKIHFENPYNFYLWSIYSLILMTFIFIIIPFVTNGRTIGMYACRIKIEFSSKDHLKQLLKREMFFSVLWILNIFLLTTLLNHTLINKFAIKSSSSDYTTLDSLRIGIYTSINSIALVVQIIFALSIIVRKNNEGLHDKYSETKTVWINKYLAKTKEDNIIKSFKPYEIENENITWEENHE